MGSSCYKLQQIRQSLVSTYSEWILESLHEIQHSFLITDPSIAGHPIVFASRAFLDSTGYSEDEVVGQNGRMFQGPETDRRAVMEMREAVREERGVEICLLNYRKDGMPNWILFRMFPVFGVEDGRVVHFVAVQIPIRRRSACGGGRRGVVVGGCRNEFRLDEELCCDSRVLEAEELPEPSEREKEKAVSAANAILSMLACCSKMTGRVVSGSRCKRAGIGLPFSSSLSISLGRIKQSFVLSDPHIPNMPVVYASDEFLNLTGYCREEVLGRNSRFLSGCNTDSEALHQIMESIQSEQACKMRLLSYRKDGSSFWDLLHISPVRGASGKVAFFVEVHFDEHAKCDGHGLSPEMRQLGVIASVKVAVRSLSMCPGPSRPSS